MSDHAQPPAQTAQPADPCAMVIFGAAGDLTRRKLVPSLYNLANHGLLGKEFAVIGFAINPMSDDEFRAHLAEALREFEPSVDAALWDRLSSHFHYLTGDFTDPAAYAKLKDLLLQVEKEAGVPGNVVYYLATPPTFFSPIAAQLGKAELVKNVGDPSGWTRIVIEKPFGRDLESAQQLNRELLSVFDERQIYRIDHYLGKETVQNILSFRFANGVFEPVWNRRYIDHVQIMVAESIGIEGRASYYETAGALRDILQNHMFQVLCLVAMEPPTSFEAEALRDEKVKILRAIRPMTPEEILQFTVRGQYGPGVIDGERVPGYRSEPNVFPTSTTETYAAVKIFLENWRWADVPFYLRTGKRLKCRDTEIVIQFRRVPLLLFPHGAEQLAPNRLTVHIQPDERITLRFQAKQPGPAMQLVPVEMEFRYGDLGGDSAATGYETLIYDCMIGDSTLFHRADMVEAAWKVATPILDVWKALPPRDFPNYAAGTWGPAAADDLIRHDGREWVDPT
jgi:glucose-6-phosphate 1-dehydrogenase